MRVVIQRVREASVTINEALYSQIGYGYLLLVGISNTDDEQIVRAMAEKVLFLRICDDENHKMNRSIQDIGGQILSVSQFTLYADARKGRRPSFTDAGEPQKAKELYEYFNKCLAESGLTVKSGVFQEEMAVGLVNDGPVTILLDSDIILKK